MWKGGGVRGGRWIERSSINECQAGSFSRSSIVRLSHTDAEGTHTLLSRGRGVCLGYYAHTSLVRGSAKYASAEPLCL